MQGRRMKTISRIALGICAVFAIYGCGGVGNGQAFIGSFDGTWTDPNALTSGPAQIVVDQNAHVTGTWDSTGADGVGTISGSIFATGWVSADVTFPNSNTMHLEGTLGWKDPNAKPTSGLEGALQGTENGVSATYQMNLDRPAGP